MGTDDVGLVAMRARLNEHDSPTGQGVLVALVEADAQTGKSSSAVHRYMPDASHPGLRDVTFVDMSKLTSPPEATSQHGTNMARNLCGSHGVAPGVAQVDVFLSRHWLAGGSLRTLSPSPPATTSARVVSHSWISPAMPASKELGLSSEEVTADVLRRVDYVVEHSDTIMVVGVNNGPNEALPPLLAQAYNVIAVGVSDGSSSLGPTTLPIEIADRSKPDLVSPSGTTSEATARVAGAAALLVETAARHVDQVDARAASHAVTVKAVLLAGATKEEPEFDRPWMHSPEQPLDPRRGAGEINIDNSQRLLNSARVGPGATATAVESGWDYSQIRKGQTLRYEVEVPEHHRPKALSVVIAWNRKIDVRTISLDKPARVLARPLANLDLRVTTMGATGNDTTIAESISAIDNVEHVYITMPAPGRYVVEVSCLDGETEFALAWQARGDLSAPIDELPMWVKLGLLAGAAVFLFALGVLVFKLRDSGRTKLPPTPLGD